MKFTNLFAVTALICSLASPAIAQSNDPLLNNVIRDRQNQQDSLDGQSMYRQMQAKSQQRAEQEALQRNVSLLFLALGIGGFTLYWFKSQSKLNNRKSTNDEMLENQKDVAE